jgi:hypothetical protein
MSLEIPRSFAVRLPASVRWNRKLYSVSTRHLSARGLSFTLDQGIPAGQTLAVWLDDPEVADYPVDGIVHWVRKLPLWTIGAGGPWEMGVRFLMWNDPYFRFLERYIKDSVEKRKHQRYEEELKVVLGPGRREVEECTRNISAGGLAIEATRELEAGVEVRVGLTIPDLLDQVQLQAEVVRVKPPPERGTWETALSILRFEGDDGLLYDRYLEYLRKLYAFAEA